MTASEWFASASPLAMLDFLSGNLSDRKKWLWAAACCRTAWNYTTNWPKRVREAVDATEQWADREGDVAPAPLGLRVGVRDLWRESGWHYEATAHPNALALYAAHSAMIRVVGRKTGYLAINFPAYWDSLEDDRRLPRWRGERARQCALLRDICGDPFRPVPPIDPAWLTWNDATVANIARSAYDERAFECLPVLADALLDAGCDNADLLTHCREPGQHVRGCWVVDLLLGKG
jgi:hypothetical protein